MYDIHFIPEFDEFMEDLSKKEPTIHDQVIKKITDIAETLEWSDKHYKNLQHPLNRYRRVHLNKTFVLVFRVDHNKHMVEFYVYDHHNYVYQNKTLREY
ncbi:MAG: type II toxin-antitoxin system RelE family toxin [Methanothermobacter sp.]